MASLTRGIFIVAAKRTPFGRYGGQLAKKSPTDLQEVAAKAALAAANISPSNIDSVVIGNVKASSAPDAGIISRHVGLRCGVPLDTPCLTVNRLCGSSFQSIINGAHDILMGDSRIVLTGGSENMSLSPYFVRDIRFGTKLGSQFTLEDSLLSLDSYCQATMGITAENLAEKCNITREDSDMYAYRSQMNHLKAQEEGIFDDEMAPIELKTKKGIVNMTVDEHPRPKSTLEGLAKLPPAFKKDGIVTAGNASGICDGAGSVIIASEEALKEHNLKPLARLVGYGIAGVEPAIMGIGPVNAIEKLLKVTGVKMNDIGMVEINEAFAPQTIACQRALDLNPDILNVNGGAIAVGHPLGASGARITSHIVHYLRRKNMKYGIGSACIGGGQGIALLIEKL